MSGTWWFGAHSIGVTSYPMFLISIKRFCYSFITEWASEASRHFVSFLSSFDRKIIPETSNPDNQERVYLSIGGDTGCSRKEKS